jgi:hypothetical protein
VITSRLIRTRFAAAVGPWALGLILALGGPGDVSAQDVPPERQVLILTRALAYDDEIKNRAGDDVLIGVVSKVGNAASDAMAGAMLKAFRGIGGVKVQGLSLKFTQLAFTSGPALQAAAASQNVDVMYVCAGLEADLPAIIEVTRKRRTISIGSREEHVQRGLAIGVFQVDGKPTIVVNLPAAKAEGSAFSSDLLRLAKVIK